MCHYLGQFYKKMFIKKIVIFIFLQHTVVNEKKGSDPDPN